MTYTEARKKASIKYNREHQKRIPLSVKNEFYEQIKAAADAAGETVNGYIKVAIVTRMKSEGQIEE